MSAHYSHSSPRSTFFTDSKQSRQLFQLSLSSCLCLIFVDILPPSSDSANRFIPIHKPSQAYVTASYRLVKTSTTLSAGPYTDDTAASPSIPAPVQTNRQLPTATMCIYVTVESYSSCRCSWEEETPAPCHNGNNCSTRRILETRAYKGYCNRPSCPYTGRNA